jgi:hypothetical protein
VMEESHSRVIRTGSRPSGTRCRASTVLSAVGGGQAVMRDAKGVVMRV